MLFWLANNSYNLLLAFGGIVILWLMVLRCRQYRLTPEKAVILGLILLLCAVLGAKLLFILENRGDTSGMSLFGAVYLVLIVMPLIGRLFSLGGNETLDACAPCGAAIIGFCRFGCYINGCCGGWYTSIGGHIFQWPTQLIESFCDFMIMGFLLMREKQPHRRGSQYGLFLVLYCTSRFLIEFLRDTHKDWFLLSRGQWFSVLGFVLGLMVLIYSHSKKEENREKSK